MPNTSHSLQRLVKNRVSKAEHIDDRFSNLPDTLLLLILSFLPTNFAARTSVLSCRFFRLIWEATHHIEDCDPNYLSKDGCALLKRDPSYPLIHLTLRPHEHMTGDELASLLLKVKDQSPDLRHLRIDISAWQIVPVLPIIFSFHNLLSLNFGNRTLFSDMYFRGPFLPSNISLTRLKSLSLRLIESPILSELVSRLYCLEELYLELKYSYINLTSHTVRKLKIAMEKCMGMTPTLCMPNLEYLDIKISNEELPCFRSEMPHLRIAFIFYDYVSVMNVDKLLGFLKYSMNVEKLKLDLAEHPDFLRPFHMLRYSREFPAFPYLKSLDLSLCFHKKNLKGLIGLLQNCPILESLKLNHKGPHTIPKSASKPGFRSWLPRNTEGNYQHAYFDDLHIGENKKQVMELLNKKRISKKLKIWRLIS